MDLSVITVTWNSAQYITEQIRSVIWACRHISYEHIIVDNASTDKTIQLVREIFSHCAIIENTTNTGFACANNQGVRISQGKYILFLNPDVRIQEGTLDAWITWMEDHSAIAISGCRLIDTDGYATKDHEPRRFPTLGIALALLFKLPHIFPKILQSYYYCTADFEQDHIVDSVRGSCMLVRRECVDSQGQVFDPRYFIWFEDVDLCREAKLKGFFVSYTPIVTAVDYVGRSFARQNVYWKQKQFLQSMLQYFKKWEPWHVWIWIALVRPIVLCIAYMMMCLTHKRV